MESHLGLLNCSILLKHDFVHGVVIFGEFYKLLKKSIQCHGIVYIHTHVRTYILFRIQFTGQYRPMGLAYQFVGSGDQADGQEGSRWADGRAVRWWGGRAGEGVGSRVVARLGTRMVSWPGTTKRLNIINSSSSLSSSLSF